MIPYEKHNVAIYLIERIIDIPIYHKYYDVLFPMAMLHTNMPEASGICYYKNT
mgnify:CR=1 FL=1